MNAVILLLDVNSWLLWLIPHHHSRHWAEDFVRIRTPTGPNNGSAEKRRGKRRGGSPKCKFTLSVSPQRNSEGTRRSAFLSEREADVGEWCRRRQAQVCCRRIHLQKTPHSGKVRVFIHLCDKSEEGKLNRQRLSAGLRPVKSSA